MRSTLLTESGAIATLGNQAHDVEASSVGGVRGTGGSAAGGGGGGGSGQTGGAGGLVSVNVNGTLATGGSDAYGILAQSVGGGGGTGSGFSGIAGSGGAGSGGGSSGLVDVTAAGQITTIAAGSFGIMAQSVGGGGGAGGSSFGIVALGGDGGGASPAGDVQVTNVSTITTAGSLDAGLKNRSGQPCGRVGNARNGRATCMVDARREHLEVSAMAAGAAGSTPRRHALSGAGSAR